MLRRAVERELEIIGEATNHLLDIDPVIQIENGRRIVDLRNFVIHGYDKVDNGENIANRLKYCGKDTTIGSI